MKRARLETIPTPSGRKATTPAESLVTAHGSVDEKTRLIHVLENVPAVTIVDKIKKKISSSEKNAELIASLSELFDKTTYPPRSAKLLICIDCGKQFDPLYNFSSDCKVLHQITRAWTSGNETAYECDECEQTWIREWDDTLCGDDVDEVGYCFEGCHRNESQ